MASQADNRQPRNTSRANALKQALAVERQSLVVTTNPRVDCTSSDGCVGWRAGNGLLGVSNQQIIEPLDLPLCRKEGRRVLCLSGHGWCEVQVSRSQPSVMLLQLPNGSSIEKDRAKRPKSVFDRLPLFSN
jgi:hypothetical protein